MSKAYYTYRICVANSQSVQIEKLDPNNTILGKPQGKLNIGQKLPTQIQQILNNANQNQLNNSHDVKLLGEALFNILFDQNICQDFLNFYQQVIHQKEQLLRIEIDINEQILPQLAALPWEFMCVPMSANAGTIYLGTTPNLTLSRRRILWNSPQIRKNQKLSIALVISAPKNLGNIQYQKIQNYLQTLAKQQPNLVDLFVINPANRQDINTILRKKPNIFHFIGHGRFNNSSGKGIGQIALVDELDEADWVDSEDFSELFSGYHPEVVILQACQGGSLSPSIAFVGVASKLIQQSIPIVIAMQYEVSNSTSNKFAHSFYDQLLQRTSVDLSVQEARRTIGNQSLYKSRDFATPVIFMSVQDAQLFKPAEPIIKREKVFISYSYEDREWLVKLQIMLRPLERAGKISVWDNTKIKAGDITEEAIKNALAEAKIAVLLVSANFLASDDILEQQLLPLLKAAEQEGLIIIWIYVSASFVEETEINRYQPAHDISQPLDSLSAADVNRVLVSIAKKIKEAADS